MLTQCVMTFSYKTDTLSVPLQWHPILVPLLCRQCLFRFDFVVTLVSAVGVLLELVDRSLYFLLVFRPLRLLR